jgi:hypothetical protein
LLFYGPREAQAGNAGADHHDINFSGLHVLLIRGSIFSARIDGINANFFTIKQRAK